MASSLLQWRYPLSGVLTAVIWAGPALVIWNWPEPTPPPPPGEEMQIVLSAPPTPPAPPAPPAPEVPRLETPPPPAPPRPRRPDRVRPNAPQIADAVDGPPQPPQPYTPPGPPGPVGPPVDPSAALQASYVSSVRQQINAMKRYPTSREARQLQPQGTVTVAFTLTRGGELSDVSIAKSSGSRILDDAAVATVRRGRFPPFPAEAWKGQASHRFTVELDFVIS